MDRRTWTPTDADRTVAWRAAGAAIRRGARRNLSRDDLYGAALTGVERAERAWKPERGRTLAEFKAFVAKRDIISLIRQEQRGTLFSEDVESLDVWAEREAYETGWLSDPFDDFEDDSWRNKRRHAEEQEAEERRRRALLVRECKALPLPDREVVFRREFPFSTGPGLDSEQRVGAACGLSRKQVRTILRRWDTHVATLPENERRALVLGSPHAQGATTRHPPRIRN